MARLFVTRRLPVDAQAVVGDGIDVTVFDEDRTPRREELLEAARGVDGLVTTLSDRVDDALLLALPEVRVVANYAVGFDNVDVTACTDRGVWVTNTPDVLTEATADLTWALILAVCRRVREGESLLRGGHFRGWSPTMLLGAELCGRTLGIFGMGRIGRAVARRAAGFGMRVIHSSRSGGVSKLDLLAQADVVSIHCPLDDSTRHAFDAEAFQRMKATAVLVNTSRGPVVDEQALVCALEGGQIAGAGLDVFEREPEVHQGLVTRDDVVLLPHLGSATTHTRRRMAEIALSNASAVLRGERPPQAVNEPQDSRREPFRAGN